MTKDKKINIEQEYDEQELSKLRRKRAKEDEFNRRVRAEIRRIAKGEADDDILLDEQREEEKEQQEREQQEREQGRNTNPILQLFTGSILLRKDIQGIFRHLIVIATLSFFSIVTMFKYLHVDVLYNQLTNEVHLLREQSLRVQSEKYSKSSHTAITKKLKQRGIDLHDPSKPRVIIEQQPQK